MSTSHWDAAPHNTDLLTLLWFCLASSLDGPTLLLLWQRAAGVLSNILPQSPEAVERAIQDDVVRTMHRLLKVCNCIQTWICWKHKVESDSANRAALFILCGGNFSTVVQREVLNFTLLSLFALINQLQVQS